MSYIVEGPVDIGDASKDTVIAGNVSIPDVTTVSRTVLKVDTNGNVLPITKPTTLYAGPVLLWNIGASIPEWITIPTTMVTVGTHLSNDINFGGGGLATIVLTNWQYETFDVSNVNFNTTTGIFSVPRTGIYVIAPVVIYSCTAPIQGYRKLSIYVNGIEARTSQHQPTPDITVPKSLSYRIELSLNAGDIIDIRMTSISDGGKNSTVTVGTRLSIHLLVT